MILDILYYTIGSFLLVVAIWLATGKRFWATPLRRNTIKLIGVMGAYRYYIYDVPGYKKNIRTGDLEKGGPALVQDQEPPDEFREWFLRTTGHWWISWNPFFHTIRFQIIHERMREDESSRASLREKFENTGKTWTEELWHRFPRPFFADRLEIAAQFAIDIIVLGQFVVRNPEKFIIELRNQGFIILRAFVLDVITKAVRGMRWEDIPLMSAEDLLGMNAGFNTQLSAKCGLSCDVASKYDPEVNPRDVEIYKALQEDTKAHLTGKAEVTKADYLRQAAIKTSEGKRDARKNEGVGEAAYLIKVGEGQAEAYGLLVQEYINKGYTFVDALAAANQRILTDIQFGHLKGLKTYVASNAGVGVNINTPPDELEAPDPRPVPGPAPAATIAPPTTNPPTPPARRPRQRRP